MPKLKTSLYNLSGELGCDSKAKVWVHQYCDTNSGSRILSRALGGILMYPPTAWKIIGLVTDTLQQWGEGTEDRDS